MTDTDPTLMAAVIDQERRLRALEQVVGGEKIPLNMRRLRELYLDSARVQEPAEAEARHWARDVLHLDCCQLLALAKLFGDPFPWHPLMLVLDACAERGHDVEDARSHLLTIARDLLRAQGLELIEPRDVMPQPTRMKAAAGAIRKRAGFSARGGSHG